MSIALDTSVSPAGGSGTSYTYSHTCSGTNRILFVGIIGDNLTDNITGVTYNGVAMTLIAKVQVPSDRWHYLFYLVAPATGANNVVISATGTGFIIPGSISYTGVRQVSPIDGSTTNTATAATSLSTSITTSVDGCWGISTFRSGATVTPSGYTNDRNFFQAGTTAGLCDSNSPVLAGNALTLGNTSASSNWAMVMATFAPAQNLLTDNLISYYKLDGNSNDSVGGNNGTDTAITYNAGNGKIIQGAGFNGSTSNITSASASLGVTGSMSVSAWINPASLPTSGNIYDIVAKFTNATGGGFDLRLRNISGTQALEWSSGSWLITYNVTIPTSAWTHVVAVNNGNNNYLYVNGVLVGTATGSNGTAATNNFYIGAMDYGAGVTRYFNGAIDEVGFWSKPLNTGEIRTLYNAGVGNQYPFVSTTISAGLTGYYKLDGNSNDSLGASNGSDTAMSYSAAGGKIIQGGVFNGTTSTITSASTAYNFTGPVSISAWINPAALPTSGNIMSFCARFTNTFLQYGWDMRLNNNAGVPAVTFNLTQASGSNVTAAFNTTLTLGTWYHIVGVNDGLNSYLYINGAQVATAVGGNTGQATNNLYIGAINYNAGVTRYFNGDIDEVGIWNRSLAPSEITQLYSNGVGTQYPNFGFEAAGLLALV